MTAEKPAKILVVKDLEFEYKEWCESASFEIKDVALTLRRGKTLGLLGANGSGKTTVAKLILHGAEYGKTRENSSKALWPSAGSITYKRRNFIKRSKTPLWIYGVGCMVLTVALSLVLMGVLIATRAASALQMRPYSNFATECYRAMAVLFKLSVDDAIFAVQLILGAVALGMVVLVVEWCCRSMSYKRYLRNTLWADLGFISSELLCSGEAKRVDPEMTVEKTITMCMPDTLSAHGKRKWAIELLTQCHFSMYKDGEPIGSIPEYFKQKLLVGKLSGGQTHLIHILQVLCSRPRVLICDELLGGLDQRTQIAVLKLIREQQRSTGMAVLYISTEMGPMQVMAHEVAFMYEGTVAIQGPPEKVFGSRDSQVSQYISASRSIFKNGDPAVHFRSQGVGLRC